MLQEHLQRAMVSMYKTLGHEGSQLGPKEISLLLIIYKKKKSSPIPIAFLTFGWLDP